LFIQLVKPNVPPSVPRSFITPCCHKNGSMVGTPVAGFFLKLVNDSPAICPRWFTKPPRESGPPRVPRLPGLPPCHRVVRNWVALGKGLKNFAHRSRVLLAAHPATCPRSLMLLAQLSWPPRVPRSISRPFLDMTAWVSGMPVSGSSFPVSETPTPTPAPLSSNSPDWYPCSAPRSVMCPLRHSNA